MCGANSKSNASNNSVNPRTRPGPRQLDLPHPMSRTAHPGHPGVQVRLVLEEVQMTPRLGLGVVHRARRLVTLRTGKPGTTGKVDAQIHPALLGVERGLDHPPRLDHPQPGRKHLELVHTTALRYARS